MTRQNPQVLVLRHPEGQGNFVYWMAELPDEDARRWKDRLSASASTMPAEEIDTTFGKPLRLDEVMQRLHAKDFQVLDYPDAH